MAVVEKIGSVFDINTITAGIQFVPAVSALRNGGFVVTWADFDSASPDDPSGSAVRAQIFDDQAFRSGVEFLVPENTGLSQSQPDVATLSDGSFVITWTREFETTDLDVKAQRFSETGVKLDSERVISQGSSDDEFDPSITAQPGLAGNYLVTWTEDDNRIHFRQDAPDGTLLSSGLVDFAGPQSESSSSVTALVNGSYVCAFQQDGEIFQRPLVGGVIGSNANTTTTGEQRTPSVSALEDGGYVVVWTDRELFVKGQRFDANGNTAGEEFNVHGVAGSVDFTTPIVKPLIGGGFIVVWDDRNEGLRAQSFDESAAKIGGIVQLTPDGGPGSFGDADVTIRRDGDVVVVWGGSDAAGAGIQGQVLRVFNTVNGTGGNDRLLTQLNGAASNLVPGFEASDIINGFGGNDTLQGRGGAKDILNGGAGIDTASYIDSLANVTANLLIPAFSNGDAIGDTYDSIENLEGSFFDDQLTGNALANQLDGVDGDDFLEGLGGNDRLLGNFGNDDLEGGNGNDVLDGQDGADALNGGLGNDTYVLSNGVDKVTDSGGIDRITSTISRKLTNFATIDNLTLLGVADINGTGNALANAIAGNTGKNILNGGIGIDLLTGGLGNDTLNGGADNDTLVGGLGRDRFTGGAGRDLFDFNTAAQTGRLATTRDIVTDFLHLTDRLDLFDIDAIPGGANNAFVFRGTAAFTAAGQVRLLQSGANTIVEINTTGPGTAEAAILLAGITASTLTAVDFVL